MKEFPLKPREKGDGKKGRMSHGNKRSQASKEGNGDKRDEKTKEKEKKQGRIHGNPVADGRAGAIT